jgi:hypothetical protein
MFKVMVSLLDITMVVFYSHLGSLHTYCTLKRTLITPLIEYLYIFANDLSPKHGSSFTIITLEWTITTYVPFPRMYGIAVGRGPSHWFVFLTIHDLISFICPSSCNYACSSTRTFPYSSHVRGGRFPCIKCTHEST